MLIISNQKKIGKFSRNILDQYQEIIILKAPWMSW